MISKPTPPQQRYPLLAEILTLKELPLKAMYTTSEIARIFGVTPRAIQNRIASGQLRPRKLPGRAKFLTQDLEEFLHASSQG